MKRLLLAFSLVATSAQAQALYTTCEETTDGRMAIQLDPALKGDQEKIALAVKQCKEKIALDKILFGEGGLLESTGTFFDE